MNIRCSFCVFLILLLLLNQICNFVYSLQEIAEEAPLHIPEQDPPKEWPQHGVVKFDNYQTRYRPGLDLVLKGKAWDICFLCHTVVRWYNIYLSKSSSHLSTNRKKFPNFRLQSQ